MIFDGKSQLLDAQVRAARERGAFDNLPGHGKPLPPEELTGLTPEQRFEVLMFRSCGELLPEVTLLREVRAGRAQLLRCTSPQEREALASVLRAKAHEVSRRWRSEK